MKVDFSLSKKKNDTVSRKNIKDPYFFFLGLASLTFLPFSAQRKIVRTGVPFLEDIHLHLR